MDKNSSDTFKGSFVCQTTQTFPMAFDENHLEHLRLQIGKFTPELKIKIKSMKSSIVIVMQISYLRQIFD